MKIYLLSNEETRKLSADICCKIMPRRFERAQRYRFEKDRLMCLGAGWLLHHVLSVPETAVRLTENGKPYIENGNFFSLSHAGGFAAAVMHKEPVGVDIEEIGLYDPLTAEMVFTAEERQWIAHSPDRRFYCLWSIKESILKAAGTGLSAEPLSVVTHLSAQKKTVYFQQKCWYFADTVFRGLSVAAAGSTPVDRLDIMEVRISDPAV